MPIQISLFDLVKKHETEEWWPEDFRGKIDKILEAMNEKTVWGVIADWLDESDEPRLAEGFRWVAKRDLVEIRMTKIGTDQFLWYFVGLPASVLEKIEKANGSTIPMLVARLVEAVEAVRNEVS